MIQFTTSPGTTISKVTSPPMSPYCTGTLNFLNNLHCDIIGKKKNRMR